MNQSISEIISKYKEYGDALSWWGNSVTEYVVAFIALIVFLFGLKIFQHVVLLRLQKFADKSKTDLDDTLIDIVRSLRPPFYHFLALYFALRFLTLSEVVAKALNIILLVWVIYYGVIALQMLIDFAVRTRLAGGDPGYRTALINLGKIGKAILWVMGVLMVLSNLGVEVTSLIAGLGIGGVAIAFALQNILGDLFSSFAIHFDRPFVIGDFIVVGEHMGVVEKIGIKSTRLRALQGEEIVISNKELTSVRVQNFKLLKERRVVTKFGVVYQTSSKKMQKVLDTVKNIFERIEGARLDRVHFRSFDDSALSFEVVYFVESGDYNHYMDIQQDFNFALKDAFEKESIDMAYPTQTIYLEK